MQSTGAIKNIDLSRKKVYGIIMKYEKEMREVFELNRLRGLYARYVCPEINVWEMPHSDAELENKLRTTPKLRIITDPEKYPPPHITVLTRREQIMYELKLKRALKEQTYLEFWVKKTGWTKTRVRRYLDKYGYVYRQKRSAEQQAVTLKYGKHTLTMFKHEMLVYLYAIRKDKPSYYFLRIRTVNLLYYSDCVMEAPSLKAAVIQVYLYFGRVRVIDSIQIISKSFYDKRIAEGDRNIVCNTVFGDR